MDETVDRWGVQTQKLDEKLPDAHSENAFEAAAGEAFDTLGFGGILPTNGNDGGIIGNIPVMLGQGDVRNPNTMDPSQPLQALQVTTADSTQMQANPDAFVPIQESDFYQHASALTQTKIDAYAKEHGTTLYVTTKPVAITSENATYQNFTNGMMNDTATAIYNGLTQTGSETFTLNYNPSHGFMGDLLESAVDKFGGTTGMAKQTGDFIADTSAERGTEGSNYMAHSQGNALTYSGLQYAHEQGMLQEADSFIDPTKPTPEEQYAGIPSFGSFASPVSKTDMSDYIKDTLGYTYIGAITHPNDTVSETLGGNVGLNGQMDWPGRIESATNLFDLFKDPTVVTHENGSTTFEGGSPHSTYHCNELEQPQYCGNRP